MNNKILSEKYNLMKEEKTLEEEVLTTELSDHELDLMYKRYKLMLTDEKENV